MTRIWKHLPRHGDDASRNRTSQILHASGHFKFGIARCSESVIHSNHASHHTTGTRSKHNASLHCGTEICLLLLQMRMEQNHEQELSEWLHLDLLLQQSCRSPTLQYYWLSDQSLHHRRHQLPLRRTGSPCGITFQWPVFHAHFANHSSFFEQTLPIHTTHNHHSTHSPKHQPLIHTLYTSPTSSTHTHAYQLLR